MFNIRHLNKNICLGIMDLKAFAENRPGLSRREIEKQGTLCLLQELFNEKDPGLYYDINNKPHLREAKGYISISHSHDKLAIIHNKTENTGVDIELIRDKVKSIQHKFLNEQEQQYANNDEETLIKYWATKETLYKIYGKKEVDFRKHLFVEYIKGEEVLGKICLGGFEAKYLLKAEKIESYILVYPLYEIQ